MGMAYGQVCECVCEADDDGDVLVVKNQELTRNEATGRQSSNQTPGR